MREDQCAELALELDEVRGSLAASAGYSALAAAASTAIVVVVFGWEPAAMVVPGLVGTVVWGLAEYYLEVARQIPTRELPPVPPLATERQSGSHVSLHRAGTLAFAVIACFFVAWLADQWDLGAAFVPGQFAGYAAARALGALRVRRWEHSHRVRVLADLDDDKPDLYAASAT
jgi:hypothetical protein